LSTSCATMGTRLATKTDNNTMNCRMQSPGKERRLYRCGLLDHRDSLNLDHPIGMSKRGDFDERRGRALLPQILRTYRRQISAIHHVGDIGRDLDDVGHRPTLRFDQGFDRRVGAAGLGLEVAAMRGAAVCGVCHLPCKKQDGLGLRHIDALTVGCGFEYTRRVDLLDRCHWCSWIRLSLRENVGR